MYDAWGVGDFSAGSELYDPGVDFVMGPDFPDAGLYKGLEGISRYMGLFLEPWERITIKAEELEVGGDSIVVSVHQEGIGSGSGAATEFRYFHVWTFADGKVRRFETFRDRESAMEAGGAG